jgi:pyrimidine-nucleoside phosphorylase/thymidine phosphorylase
VEFEPFIVSSIVSKKIAEGAGALVYDVKCGNGAFMKTRDRAVHLAERLVATTRGLGRRAAAVVTDMNQPLGRACGNALEVRESLDVLRGGGPADVRALTLGLAGRMLVASGAEKSFDAALSSALRALDSGIAYEKFLAMVEAQGGNAKTLEQDDGLPRAGVVTMVTAPRSGIIESIDTFAMGELLVAIGAGRRRKEDSIDPAVGVMVQTRLGDRVSVGAPLAELHLAAPDADAAARLRDCFVLGDGPVVPPPLTIASIDPD